MCSTCRTCIIDLSKFRLLQTWKFLPKQEQNSRIPSCWSKHQGHDLVQNRCRWRIHLRVGQSRGIGSWARIDGRRARAIVIHPKLPGDREESVAWDAAEALALARALNWRVDGADADADDDEEEDTSDSDQSDHEEEEAPIYDLTELVSDSHLARMDRIDSRFFFHMAELSRIAVRVARTRSDILFVNAALTPTQQRHIEAAMDLAWRAKRARGTTHATRDSLHDDDEECTDVAGVGIAVFDRPRAILAIFARRATSAVARLRIELAEAQQAKAKLGSAAVHGAAGQLQRVADALVRRVPGCNRDDLLIRSGGARGVSTSFTSSPQITRQKQQRAVEEKERRVRDELSRLQSHRHSQRQRRKRLWTIALVGYTNVGKSAIVNRLTGSSLLVRDGVFVTLDVAARRVPLPSGAECYVLDSVGFVRDLPIELCDAFQATVEELQEADVVLHVRDMAHPSREEHARVVLDVLQTSGIDLDRRVIEVWNKSDLVSPKEARHQLYIRNNHDGTPVYLVSALNDEGFEDLLVGLDQKLGQLAIRHVRKHAEGSRGTIEASSRGLQRVTIPDGLTADAAAERWAFLREHCTIVEESITAEGSATILEAWMDNAARARCNRKFGPEMVS